MMRKVWTSTTCSPDLDANTDNNHANTDNNHEAGIEQRLRDPGPHATRDEYLDYALLLTRQHLELLPRSFVGYRRGETIVNIRTLRDGRIARTGIEQSSGFPDIDRRVEEMVNAVGKFPPLPDWVRSPPVDVQMSLRFPEALNSPPKSDSVEGNTVRPHAVARQSGKET